MLAHVPAFLFKPVYGFEGKTRIGPGVGSTWKLCPRSSTKPLFISVFLNDSRGSEKMIVVNKIFDWPLCDRFE